jgi:hypothetical protein
MDDEPEPIEHHPSHHHETKKSSASRIVGTIVGFVIGYLIVQGIFNWYNNNHYNSTFNNNFLTSCEAQGATVGSCSCALTTIQANYSYSQAKSFDTIASSTGQLPSAVTTLVQQDCD